MEARQWIAGSLFAIVCIATPGSANVDPFLETAAPAWVVVTLHGNGTLLIEGHSTEATEGGAVGYMVYDDTGRPHTFRASHPYDGPEVRVVAAEHDRQFAADDERYPIRSGFVVQGVLDGWSAVVFSPTDGMFRVTIKRLDGDAGAEFGARGRGGLYSSGMDLFGGTQAAVRTFAGAAVQHEAAYSFEVQNVLLGWFGADVADVAKAEISYVQGPASRYECPCIFTERDPALRPPPGRYEFVRTAAEVERSYGIPVFAVDADVDPAT